MSISHFQFGNSNALWHLSKPKSSWKSSSSVIQNPMVGNTIAEDSALGVQWKKRRIKEMLHNVGISISAYDTAWVAMVPSLSSSQVPCFPECVNWVLENQLSDGSWGFQHHYPSLKKDALNSTLACVLALRKWNVGEEHVKRGLYFIGSNSASVDDDNQHSPIGFDITFPGMLEYAKDLGLDLPLSTTSINALLLKRDLEFSRGSGSSCEGRKAYLANLGEGLGKLVAWEDIMKFQRKNGSLFNSPSTTAAALIHLQDSKCLEYLQSLLKKFGNAVPTAYPLDVYSRLCMVNSLEKLGIARHFREEIISFLDDTYRCWLQDDEELYSDSTTYAMAFRLLRMNGYEVSSDSLVRFKDEDLFSNSVGGYPKDVGSVLELYKASEIMMLPNEPVLERINTWSSCFLKHELSKSEIYANRFVNGIIQEVDYVLKFPYYASWQRLLNKRYIENYEVDDFRMRKTSFKFCGVKTNDILELAIEDFKVCQSRHRTELEHLERWVIENRLDQLQFARQRLTYIYLSAAATFFEPEMAAARMSWVKNGVLTSIVDDFFDVGGSREEHENLIQLVEKWDNDSSMYCCSEEVKIIFFALYNTINELGTKAFAWQKRSVTHHIYEIWLTLLKSMMKEAEWVGNKSVPTMDEYMRNAWVSFALGPIILPALYFVGPVISKEVVNNPEYNNLFQIVSTCGRLFNDVRSFKREAKQGKLNSIPLYMIHGVSGVTEEEAMKQMMDIVEYSTRELMRLVVQKEGSVVPRACKDLFWNMNRVIHLLYMKNDGYTFPQEMDGAVNAVIHEPLIHPCDVSKF